MCRIAGFLLGAESDQTEIHLGTGLCSSRQRGPNEEGIVLISAGVDNRIDLGTESRMNNVRLRHVNDPGAKSCSIALGYRRFELVDPDPQSYRLFWSRDGTCGVGALPEETIWVRENRLAISRLSPEIPIQSARSQSNGIRICTASPTKLL